MTLDMLPLHDKIVLITGATSGLGAAAARELARRGAAIIIVGRDQRKCRETVRTIRRSTGNHAVDYLCGDLSIQHDVRAIAKAFADRFDRLDVLINNAGGYFKKREVTSDGLEMNFALNHLAYFLLTNLFLDRLRASPAGRIVVVASQAHEGGTIVFDDLQREQRYERLEAYAQSKLANILFANELARRLQGTHITVNSLTPGSVATRIGSNNGRLRVLLRNLVYRARGHMLTPEQGARTIIYLAASPEVEGVTGCYFRDEHAIAPSNAALDPVLASELWKVSEQLTSRGGLTDTSEDH